MNLMKVAAGAIWLMLAPSARAANAEPDSHRVHVDMMESCHKGLVIWFPRADAPKCGSVQTPQVKVFDGAGRLRYIGTGWDALRWAKAGLPSTPVPPIVVVRDAASEARLTHVGAPLPGHGWVTWYASKPCPPCETQLATFRSDVMPKLGAGTTLTVFDLSAPGD